MLKERTGDVKSGYGTIHNNVASTDRAMRLRTAEKYTWLSYKIVLLFMANLEGSFLCDLGLHSLRLCTYKKVCLFLYT